MISLLTNLKAAYRLNANAFHIGIIVSLILLTFWPVLHLRFLHGWDDQWAVLNYYTEDGFTWANIYSIFTSFYSGQYAPVNQLYYTTMYALFAYDPKFYHIGSLLIHLINALLVYYFIIKIAKQFVSTAATSKQVAILTTLMFVLSPFNLEPVAWVSAAKVLLYALFYLLALHSYLKYIDTSKSQWFYLTLVCFVISFGSKEQAVTLPVCLILIDFVASRNLKDKLVWYEKMPFFVLSMLFGIVSVESQGKELLEDSNFYPLSQRVVLASYTVTEYAAKTLLPVNVSYLYPFPFQKGDQMPLWLLIYPATWTLALIAFGKDIIKRKWLAFGVMFFIIHIILVINIVSLARYSVVADRYVYISSIGSYFAIACLVMKSLKLPKLRFIIIYLFALYLCYFIIYTNKYSVIWTNAVKLKEQLRNTIRAREDFETWRYQKLDK